MALGRWTVKVHKDTGKYPLLGHRATVYTPQDEPIYYAVNLAHGIARARLWASEDGDEN